MALRNRPRTVEEIFEEYQARRQGVLNALTKDVTRFSELCGTVSGFKKRKQGIALSLWGTTDGDWITKTFENVSPIIPEPSLGVNLSKNTMTPETWLSFVARHSGAWLLSVAFFEADHHLDNDERNRLFSMISSLPTLEKEIAREKYAPDGDKIFQLKKRDLDLNVVPEPHNPNACGICGGNGNGEDAFSNNEWVFCEVCENWMHNWCVAITRTEAEKIKSYRCPTCSASQRQNQV